MFRPGSPGSGSLAHMQAPDSASAGLARHPRSGYRPPDMVVGRLNFLPLGLEVALAHEFLLHEVPDVLDVDDGLVATADAVGDALGDVDGGPVHCQSPSGEAVSCSTEVLIR